jgi:hypothetical protein
VRIESLADIPTSRPLIGNCASIAIRWSRTWRNQENLKTDNDSNTGAFSAGFAVIPGLCTDAEHALRLMRGGLTPI